MNKENLVFCGTGVTVLCFAILYSVALSIPANVVDEAMPVRLIGSCNGVLYAAQEESSFPDNCQWIEPIRIDSD